MNVGTWRSTYEQERHQSHQKMSRGNILTKGLQEININVTGRKRQVSAWHVAQAAKICFTALTLKFYQWKWIEMWLGMNCVMKCVKCGNPYPSTTSLQILGKGRGRVWIRGITGSGKRSKLRGPRSLNNEAVIAALRWLSNTPVTRVIFVSDYLTEDTEWEIVACMVTIRGDLKPSAVYFMSRTCSCSGMKGQIVWFERHLLPGHWQ